MSRTFLGALVLSLALSVCAPASASERHPTLAELERELVCPTCQTTLDQSDSPIARRMKQYIAGRVAAGDTKSEIREKLVEQFGQGVLSEPPRHGFALLAWALPLLGAGAAALALGALGWHWSRTRGPVCVGTAAAPESLPPQLERRVDEELARFDG